MTRKKIGILFGMEDTFPWALINEINARAGDRVEAGPLQVGHLVDDGRYGYDLILDRISHEVPFYRTMLKSAIAGGTAVINNPFWGAADDKFFNNVVARAAGVAVPKTVLLPHKQHPPNTEDKTFRNMRFVEWDEVFAYLGFPIFLKPAYGGGWKDVYKVDDADSFFSAYDDTRDLCMMAQEAIEFTEYYRCYVLGRERVHIMRYDPTVPFHERYVKDPPPTEPSLHERIHEDALTLCRILGYDMNTVEFAIRDATPYAIDFMNSAPDADRYSIGEDNFAWVVSNMAEILIDRAIDPRAFELTGIWPGVVGLTAGDRAAPEEIAALDPGVPVTE